VREILLTHYLEFYRPGSRRVGHAAGRFLGEAIKDGGIALAIATPRAASGIFEELSQMRQDPFVALRDGRLVLRQSTATLAHFMRGDIIERDYFERSVGATVRAGRRTADGRKLHVYGDMVGVLWRRGLFHEAIELEALFNGLQREEGFGLFCAYPIDVFSDEFTPGQVGGILGSHTHLLPAPNSTELGRALDRAIDEVLGAQADGMRARFEARARRDGPSIPKPEQNILWLRSNLPDAGAILDRARVMYDADAPRAYLRQDHGSL
jgi:hypothetical protein